jgi:hypothetical protein
MRSDQCGRALFECEQLRGVRYSLGFKTFPRCCGIVTSFEHLTLLIAKFPSFIKRKFWVRAELDESVFSICPSVSELPVFSSVWAHLEKEATTVAQPIMFVSWPSRSAMQVAKKFFSHLPKCPVKKYP